MIACSLAGAGSIDYLMDLDVLTFSALEAGVTRVSYREKIEQANASATILGLLGKEGAKPFDSMLRTWESLTGREDTGDTRAARDQQRFMRDFAGGGF